MIGDRYCDRDRVNGHGDPLRYAFWSMAVVRGGLGPSMVCTTPFSSKPSPSRRWSASDTPRLGTTRKSGTTTTPARIVLRHLIARQRYLRKTAVDQQPLARFQVLYRNTQQTTRMAHSTPPDSLSSFSSSPSVYPCFSSHLTKRSSLQPFRRSQINLTA